MSSESEEKDSKSFKVKDNRRFDSSGNERRDGDGANSAGARKPAAEAKPQNKPQPAEPAMPAADAGVLQGDSIAEGEQEFAIDFSSFVISLATQAMMQMGHMNAPDGVEVPVDRNAARQTIDILAMLQKKTKGNLEPAEQKLVEDILHNLRLNFIKVA